MLDTLDDVLTDLTKRLSDAAQNRKSAMHTPVVMTSEIDARIMVLREFYQEHWALRFHTDIRAPKVAAIKTDPRVAVLFYDKEAKLQIRARGVAEILHDAAITDAAWEASDNYARRCYLGDGPGTQADAPTSGLPAQIEGVCPSDEQIVPARENFAVLRVMLTEMDWLYLAHTGHVRAHFTQNDAGIWQGCWHSP